MVAAKYNWNELKADFLLSKYVSVSEWGRNTIGTDSGGNFKMKTNWWAEEKKRMQEEIVVRAIEEHKRKMAESYRPSIKELGEMHKALISLSKASINHEMSQCFDKETGKIVRAPSLNVINANWNLVKTEKGEATSVSETRPIEAEDLDIINEMIGDLDE